MFDEHKDDHLERMLDSLLSEYSSANPPPALETRILARLNEQVAQQPRRWAFAFATATAAMAVLLVTFSLTPGAGEHSHPREVMREPPAKTPGDHVTAILSLSAKSSLRLAGRGGVKAGSGAQNQRMLKAIDALRRNESLVFEHAELYVSPVSQEQPEPVEPRAPAPDIAIEDLGVRPIEIKELTPTKNLDEKGTYEP